ncbi:MAG: hypothetical protein R6W77_01850 [Trueperaceae bacterium]
MKGETLIVNGDPWTIVDAAPAAPLAEMVAAILEDAGFVVMVRGQGVLDDAFSHLGSTSIMTTYVLVPEENAEAAAALIAETVTDYEGDELDELLERMAAGEEPPEFADASDADPGETAPDGTATLGTAPDGTAPDGTAPDATAADRTADDAGDADDHEPRQE